MILYENKNSLFMIDIAPPHFIQVLIKVNQKIDLRFNSTKGHVLGRDKSQRTAKKHR